MITQNSKRGLCNVFSLSLFSFFSFHFISIPDIWIPTHFPGRNHFTVLIDMPLQYHLLLHFAFSNYINTNYFIALPHYTKYYFSMQCVSIRHHFSPRHIFPKTLQRFLRKHLHILNDFTFQYNVLQCNVLYNTSTLKNLRNQA